MNIYLSGPMSGHKNWNFDAFFRAEEALRSVGFKVINPAAHGHEGTYLEFMKRDLECIWNNADGVAVLPYGEDFSPGMIIEMTMAEKKGIPVKTLDEWIASPGEKCKPGMEMV